ncbi:MAG: hypothetical protein OXT67_08690, partial [Zetaproteobacteria bacterium]|nr:hypothetical protein [Zetaproteobacteria bacterium]
MKYSFLPFILTITHCTSTPPQAVTIPTSSVVNWRVDVSENSASLDLRSKSPEEVVETLSLETAMQQFLRQEAEISEGELINPLDLTSHKDHEASQEGWELNNRRVPHKPSQEGTHAWAMRQEYTENTWLPVASHENPIGSSTQEQIIPETLSHHDKSGPLPFENIDLEIH